MSGKDYQSILNDYGSSDTFSEKNHVRIVKIEPGHVWGELEVMPDTLNYGGMVHGGALATLADVSSGCCACSKGGRGVTAGFSMEYLRPAVGEKIICEAVAVKMGSSLSVIQVSMKNEKDVLVATGTFTFFMLKAGEREKKGKQP